MEREHFHLQNSCDHTLYKATQDLFDQVVEFISSFKKKE